MNDTPQGLDAHGSSPQRVRGLILLMIVLWVVAGAADWYMRFHWFRWQQNLVPVSSSGQMPPAPEMQDRMMPESKGGDLSRMLGMEKLAAEFEQLRPSYRAITDEFGFRNIPPVRDATFPIVVVGDSFSQAGDSVTNTLSGEIESISGLRTYNYSFAGRGVLYPMIRFAMDERFKERKPSVVVWGLLERDISGAILAALPYYIEKGKGTANPDSTPAAINWLALTPSALSKSLPGSSALAQVARKAWNHIRYSAFGITTPDVTAAASTIEGHRFLFESFAINALTWREEQLTPDAMAEGLRYLNEKMSETDAKLIVLLIPSKERVYESWIPGEAVDRAAIQPSVLFSLERELVSRGVEVINLLPIFRAKADEGVMLYWTDDTHWNRRGIRLAAEVVCDALNSSLQEIPRDLTR